MSILVTLFPVLLFLLFLFFLDSYKLVRGNILIICLLWGATSAALAYLSNTFVLQRIHLDDQYLLRYVFPVIEEIIKSLFVLFLIFRKKTGFMIDAAIYGFAIGTGFALIENIFYLHTYEDSGILTWLLRGLGTAIMHGGCTAVFSVIVIGGKSRGDLRLKTYLPAYLSIFMIHSAFNHFLVHPLFQTIGILILLPVFFILIFEYNEKQLQNWLELEFSSEIDLLSSMKEGRFSQTKSGAYLQSIRDRFQPETMVDMYCYLRTYLDLSIKAKRNLMLRETGLPIILEEDISDKLQELKILKKNIGKIGEMALSPLIRINYRDIWKLNTLNK